MRYDFAKLVNVSIRHYLITKALIQFIKVDDRTAVAEAKFAEKPEVYVITLIDFRTLRVETLCI